MSTKALSVDRVVRVVVNLQHLASPRRNFGTLLILGASDVIDQAERMRVYTGLDAIADDFGVAAPEYQAASLFFAQTPRPANLYIGRWLREAAPAALKGAPLPDASRAPTAWHDITAGTLALAINGTDVSLTGLDLSGVVTLEGVAQVVTTALSGHSARMTYDGDRFIVTTTVGGADKVITYATGDLAGRMFLTAQTALPPVPGANAETALEAVTGFADRSADWYGLAWADGPVEGGQSNNALTAGDHLAVSAFIEGSDRARIYAVTTTDSRVLDAGYTDDIASRLKALARKRTMVTYSQNPFAAISAIGRAFTVNFNANRSTITLKFKQLPGIVAEGLTETQARALDAKRCNVFAAYDNDTAIFQEGVMSGPAYFDEVHGLDWLKNAVQNEIWNLLYQAKTKIPQTDSGVNQIVATIEAVMGEADTNGLIAPGTWNADGFGQLERGDYLDKGWYIHAQSVDLQPQSEREQRKAPPIQVAVKLAGAIHSVDVQIDVNR